jgi:hypothetical protein
MINNLLTIRGAGRGGGKKMSKSPHYNRQKKEVYSYTTNFTRAGAEGV